MGNISHNRLLRVQIDLTQSGAEIRRHSRNIGQKKNQDHVNLRRAAQHVDDLNEIFVDRTPCEIHGIAKRRDRLDASIDLSPEFILKRLPQGRHLQPLRKAGIHRHGPVPATSGHDANFSLDAPIVTTQRFAKGDKFEFIFRLHHAGLFQDRRKDTIVSRERRGMARYGAASLGALPRLHDNHGLGTRLRSLGKIASLARAETFDVEGNDVCLLIPGQVIKQVNLTNQGLVADAHADRQAYPLILEFDQLVHQDPAALADHRHTPQFRTHHSLRRQEEGIRPRGIVNTQAVRPQKGKIRLLGDPGHLLLEIRPPHFRESARNHHGTFRARLDAIHESRGSFIRAHGNDGEIHFLRYLPDVLINLLPLIGSARGIDRVDLDGKSQAVLVQDDVGGMLVVVQRHPDDRHGLRIEQR